MSLFSLAIMTGSLAGASGNAISAPMKVLVKSVLSELMILVARLLLDPTRMSVALNELWTRLLPEANLRPAGWLFCEVL